MTSDVQAVIDAAKKKMEDAIRHLEDELKTFRAGKANPAVFNTVMVNYYGNMTPVPQVARVSSPDAKTMIIQPWDKSMLHIIEKAIIDGNLGFTPQNNGENIRINIPALTEDRRRELVKKAKNEGESARVSTRNARRDAIDILKKMQKDGLPEDAEKDAEDTIQKETDKFSKRIDEVLSIKEKEIMTV